MPRCLRAIIYDGRVLLAGSHSASSRRLVLAASRCKLSLRPGGWLYQAMLLLTRACSRSARSGGEGRVSACVSDDRACAARQPDNQAVLPARAYVRHRRLSQIFASLSFAHDTLLRDTVPRRSAQRRHGVDGADRWRTSCLFSCCRAAAARAGPGTNHQLLPTCKTRRARRSLRHVCSRTLLLGRALWLRAARRTWTWAGGTSSDIER